MTDADQRFSRIARLLGRQVLARLGRAHVCIVGTGGVGSWAAEALARSGLGRLTLVDFDAVSVSNINRQVQALDTTLGQPKVEALAARIRLINPEARVDALPLRFNDETTCEVLSPPYACVVDAIDNTSNKCRLIAGCRERRLSIVTSGGAGGRLDPTQVRTDDLAFTSHDRLLAQVRAQLRRDYGFPRRPEAFGVPCVYSTETPLHAPAATPDRAREEQPGSTATGLDHGDHGLGTAPFVTGTFGFTLASLAVKCILADGR